MPDPVWLGTPHRGSGGDEVLDPFTTKIGGPAVAFRAIAGSDPADPALQAFRCPRCHSAEHASLISQVYAPLGLFDRVVYVMVCTRCSATGNTGRGGPSRSKSGEATGPSSTPSVCYAVRSQNFSEDFYRAQLQEARRLQEEKEAAAAAVPEQPLFEEADNWGDDAGDDNWGAPVTKPESPCSAEAPAVPQASTEDVPSDLVPQEVYPLSPPGRRIPGVKGQIFTAGVALALFEEPMLQAEKLGSLEEQLAQAQERYGDGATLDTTSAEVDDETPEDRCSRKFLERLEQNPSQCVRWCPGGEPLRSSLTAINTPSCSCCGAPRQFEFQVVAPVIYYLTRQQGESSNNVLHFSNVLVFTCSRHCYDGSSYVAEHVVVEEEI